VKRGSFKFRLLTFGLVLLTALLKAQDPVFIARVSSKKVAQHSVVEVLFELQNAKGTDFRPPSFEGFTIVAGPSLGSSTMIINGVVNSSQSWSYSLLATKQGRMILDPATVVAGRRKLTTQSITIEVVKPSELNKGGDATASREPIHLRAETSADRFYPGQQIMLTYKILFRENIQTVNTLSEDDYAEFFVQPFSDFSHEATTEFIGGVPFTSRIVKSIALYAHQSGTYTIDPMVMNVGVNAPFPGNQGLFTMRRIMDVQVASEPLTITILPLPAPLPSQFSGAVGKYTLDIVPLTPSITTDEAFSFELIIKGDGDARRWDVPLPVASDSFELFDPKILEDRMVDDQGHIIHARKVLYQMIPPAPGAYTVYVPFIFFDPESGKYITMSSDSLTVEVRQGTGKRPVITEADQTVDQSFTLMKPGSVWFKDQFWFSLPHLLLFAFILSGTGYGLFKKARAQQEGRIPEAERLSAHAYEVAVRQLDELQKARSSYSDSTYVEKLTEIYHRFLMHRLKMPAGDLEELHLRRYLTETSLDQEGVQKVVSLFDRSLGFRYGGAPTGAAADKLTAECRDVMALLR
jgi:hypothetical protein